MNPINNIPTSQSDSGFWKEWYKELKNRYGHKEANALFVKAWRNRGSSKANTADFRSYMKDNGVQIDTGVIGTLSDYRYSFLSGFGDILQVEKTAGIAILGTVVVGFAIVVYNVSRKPTDSFASFAKSVAKMTPKTPNVTIPLIP